MNPVILSTAYWPNLHYFYHVINSQVILEAHEHYQKQSFRNRTQILSCNGVLNLNIPVKNAGKTTIEKTEISYAENWQIKHWRAIESAYGNSPYFGFFEKEIQSFYTQKYPFLLEYNTGQLKTVLKILRTSKTISFTTEFKNEAPGFIDLRNTIHPKVEIAPNDIAQEKLDTNYYQTFGEKFPFTKNLSILDLLFNTGLETLSYLRQ